MRSRIELLGDLLKQVAQRIKPTTPEGEKLRAEIVAVLADSTGCPRCAELEGDIKRFKEARQEIWRTCVNLKTADEQRRDREESAAIAEADLLADLGLERR